MHDLLYFNGSTVLAGSDESWGPCIALQSMVDALRRGYFVVEVLPYKSDSLRDQAAIWLREFDDDPALIKHFGTVEDAWQITKPEALARRILDAGAIAPNLPIVVYHVQSTFTFPYLVDHWLPRADAALTFLPNTSICTALTWGSALAPAPKMTQYAADRIWRLRASHHAQVSLTDIKTGQEIRLQGRQIGAHKLTVFKEVELHHV